MPSSYGRILMLLSALCFGFMALFTRVLTNLPSAEKVFFRSTLGLLITLGLVAASGQKLGRPRRFSGLVWRGVFGSLALLCYFYAIDRCGLPKATLYCYTYPLWATLLAWFELDERPSQRVLVSMLVAVVGVAITLELSPTSFVSISLADVVGLLAGVFTGAAIVSVRRLRQVESSWWIVIFFTGVGIIFSLPFVVVEFKIPNVSEWLVLFLMAASAAIAQLVMTKAYRSVRAAEGSLLSLTVVPWSSLFSVVFLGEFPPARFWVGAALVFGAVAWLVYEQRSTTPSSEREVPLLE
ncbi:MAG: DMT family transporter [Candidatus Sumerlaeaceae bacterium]|nr:DMT family transporter [Candidatus Sumerlaeaceae bacterium]